MADPHEIIEGRCDHCGKTFEDLRIAIEESGGWCPSCDRPARDVVVHVCLPVESASSSSVLPSSRQLGCDRCGRACWYDPRSCLEMPATHTHRCIPCVEIEYPQGAPSYVTAGALRRAADHLRRN